MGYAWFDALSLAEDQRQQKQWRHEHSLNDVVCHCKQMPNDSFAKGLS